MGDFLDEGMDGGLEFFKEFKPLVVVLVEDGFDLGFQAMSADGLVT